MSKLDDIIKNVDGAIKLHREGKESELSLSILLNVKDELNSMKKYQNPKIFKPSYSRFVLDYPSKKTKLINDLLNYSYNYNKIKT